MKVLALAILALLDSKDGKNHNFPGVERCSDLHLQCEAPYLTGWRFDLSFGFCHLPFSSISSEKAGQLVSDHARRRWFCKLK